MQALEELRNSVHEAHTPLKEARSASARTVAGAAFDEGAWNEVNEKVQTAGQRVREAVHIALTKIHATLDDRQRQKLASLIQSGPCHGW